MRDWSVIFRSGGILGNFYTSGVNSSWKRKKNCVIAWLGTPWGLVFTSIVEANGRCAQPNVDNYRTSDPSVKDDGHHCPKCCNKLATATTTTTAATTISLVTWDVFLQNTAKSPSHLFFRYELSKLRFSQSAPRKVRAIIHTNNYIISYRWKKSTKSDQILWPLTKISAN